MKTIKKIKESSKAVAGSALLVGATLAGGAAFATASSHNMGGSSGDATLGDYPGHFIGEDGTVSSTVVMGEDAASVDVVAGAAIAGQLGNNAFMTETVSAGTSGGSVAGSFTAENGITLNRRNSDLFLDDRTGDGQTRIDGGDVPVLEDTTVSSADNNEVDVEYDVRVGDNPQQFTEEERDNPFLNLHVPQDSDLPSQVLFNATVDFGSTMDFGYAGESGDSAEGEEYLEDGDEIELFGTTYTYSDESTDSELVLYGSSDRAEVNTGETTTVTVNGNELTVGATFVSGPEVATVTVDGVTESVEEGDSVGPNGNIRVSDVFQTGPDGQGRVAFSQGSNELKIDANGDVEVNGDSQDGVEATVESASASGDFNATESITFSFGAVDSEDDFIAPGERYESPIFGLEFHYGGLSPDVQAAEDAAGVIELSATEDGTADLTFTNADGEEGTVAVGEFDGTFGLGDADGTLALYEGQHLQEDDRVVLNSFEESGLYEVTSLSTDVGTTSEGDVSVTVNNLVTGESVTVEEEDLSGSRLDSDSVTLQGESVEGKDFDVTFTSDSVAFESPEAGVQVYPSLYTTSGASLSVADEAQVAMNRDLTSFDGNNTTVTYEFPSTAASGDTEVAVQYEYDGTDAAADIGADNDLSGSEVVVNDGSGTVMFEAGQGHYNLTLQESGDGVVNATFEPSSHGGMNPQFGEADYSNPVLQITQPENDDDQQEVRRVQYSITEDSGVTVDDDYYSAMGMGITTGFDNTLDDSDVDVGYDEYGAYFAQDREDSDDQSFTMHMPSGQATSGFGFTGADGALNAGAVSGDTGGAVETMTPTGFSSQYTALDSDSSVSSAKQNRHLVLVGGPAVNSVVGELVEANETMAGSEYTEGQGMLQLVEDAFSEGHDALIVAGFSGEDTRAAGEFLVNHDENSDALEGSTQVTVNTAEGTVVQ